MRQQLDRLLDAAAERRTTVQVLPFDQGGHEAMGGSLTILRLPDDSEVAYTEGSDYGRLSKNTTVERSSRPDLNGAAWRRSSHSNQEGGNCVEAADGFPGVVPVRDSKVPHGPALTFEADSWAAFTSELRAGQYRV